MNASRPSVSIHWFRHDLRLEDNHALFRALNEQGRVLPLFIFDTGILDRLEDRADRRMGFIHRRLLELKAVIEAQGGALLVKHGGTLEAWMRILERYDVKAVYAARDHEPYARERDRQVAALLQHHHIPFITCKDQTVFERDEVMKDDGTPYTVYTPYMKRWRSLLRPEHLASYPSEGLLHRFARLGTLPFPSLSDLGFGPSDHALPEARMDDGTLKAYAEQRDRPDLPGTTLLSSHLRFGTLSIRAVMRTAMALSEKLVNELAWREFYMQILWHFPHVVDHAFKPAYDRIEWRNDTEQFEAWCEGRTGYPLVDAGMHELNATGLMHNRVRMVVASFLTKHLLIDRRWGEAYFAAKLLDFELSSNNGNWQWAAGSGCDAAPYFRVFNPAIQLARFDPQLKYVKQWLPGWPSANYARPIVVHEKARDRAIKVYRDALGEAMPAAQGTNER